MKVTKKNVIKDIQSCNFCSKGELNSDEMRLKYPYEDVYEFVRDTGSGLCASICKECATELLNKINQ